MSLREQVLAANDLERRPVEVPEWSLTVHVRSLTDGEHAAYMTLVNKAKSNGHWNFERIRAELVRMATVDEDGSPVFLDASEVEGKSSAAVQRIFDAIQEHNLMTQDVQEIAGNSPEATSGSGST